MIKDSVAIIGDIHGEAKQLEDLLSQIKNVSSDIIVYHVGDIIDRGPDSAGVIELCIKNSIQGIKGNHELWFDSLINKHIFDSFCIEPVMGGKATFESYGIVNFKSSEDSALKLLNNVPLEHREYIKSLKDYMAIEVDGVNYYLIHSGLSDSAAKVFLANNSFSDVELLDAIVNSGKCEGYIQWPSPPVFFDRITHGMYKFQSGTQVFGHKPFKNVKINDDFISLDTGCGTCWPYRLSAILLPSRTVLTATNAKEG